MLNLRLLGQESRVSSGYIAPEFSLFSAPNFGVLSAVLGNIGESIDYSQGERVFNDIDETDAGGNFEASVMDPESAVATTDLPAQHLEHLSRHKYVTGYEREPGETTGEEVCEVTLSPLFENPYPN